MLQDAEQFKAEDQHTKERLEAKSNFEAYAFAIKQAIDESGNRLTGQEKVSRRQCRKFSHYISVLS